MTSAPHRLAAFPALALVVFFCLASPCPASICAADVDLCDSLNTLGGFLFYYECDNDYRFCLAPGGTIHAGIDLSGTDPCPDPFDFTLSVVTDCDDPAGSVVASGTVINYTSPTGGTFWLLIRRGEDDCAYYYGVECIAGNLTGTISSCCVTTGVPAAPGSGRYYDWGEIKHLFR